MKKTKLFLYITIFFIVLACIRLFWLTFHVIPDERYANDGVLDLRSENMPSDDVITLSGDWSFYPNQLLHQTEDLESSEKRYQSVQGEWEKGNEQASLQYGTYHLRLLLNEADTEKPYGIRIPSIRSASHVYLNGKSLGQAGVPAADQSDFISRNVPYYVYFYADTEEIDLFIQVANLPDTGPGSVEQHITLGHMDVLKREELISLISEIMVAVVFLIHSLYAGLIYLLGIRQKELIFFMLLTLHATLMILASDSKLLYVFLSVPYDWQMKMTYYIYSAVMLFLLLYFKYLIPDYMNNRLFRLMRLGCLVYLTFIILAPVSMILSVKSLLLLVLLIPSLIITIQLIRVTFHGMADSVYIMLGVTAVTSNVVWLVLSPRITPVYVFYPFDLLFAIIIFCIFWFKRYFRNVERTKLLSERLKWANKKKDEFLANTSHELRNPLHGIVNIAEHVLKTERAAIRAESRHDLELLLTVGRRMELLINDLLDMTQLKENQIRLQLKPVDLSAVVKGVLDMLRFMAAGKPIRFISKVTGDFPAVKADENRLLQILFNLAHNAVKYTENGSITIHASVVGTKAYISVSDTGPGIDEDVQKRMFEPYEQGDPGKAASAGGIGLGLAICKELVELHGGELTVTSSKGNGSSFTFFLPIADEIPESLEQNELFIEPEQSGASIHASEPANEENLPAVANILIVDDDPVNLHIMDKTISAEHYAITTALSGEEALEKLTDPNWDLVISDVMMPQMSGYELTEIIRKRFTISELPVLLLTARNRPEDIYTGFQSGANDYITKPVNSLELRARVRTLVHIKQTTSEHLRMEAAWLQAQIQPHFLFNTLNTILALMEYDQQKMRAVFEAFIDYLQSGFDFENSKQAIPLQQELAVVRSYLFIEQARFGDRLNVIWEGEEEIEVDVPPLSIQTLVENALNHGILKQAEGGTIRLAIIRDEQEVTISISDDGVGMPAEITRGAFTQAKPGKGVGLYNTDRRLKQLYGHGLVIQSTANKGTTVSFRVPLQNTVGPGKR
ncbi:hybrid sensor histidine kinase/response regulator [Halalkalibacter oceani]|uniref:hybrid sensor histidine kinase/response regulator n=1 Tax=Halalkalibacter oceani TaxID=1653776 RepID=UPI00339A5A56